MKWKSIIKKKTALLLIIGAVVFSPGLHANALQGQNDSGIQSNVPLKIAGKVTDSKGEAIPGVNVIVKGTNIGIVTDSKGQFTIEVRDNKAILAFSFVGMKTQEITV